MTYKEICVICRRDNPNCNRKCEECIIMTDKESTAPKMSAREVLNVLNDRRTIILNPFYSKVELEEIQRVVVHALIYKVALEELNEIEKKGEE